MCLFLINQFDYWKEEKNNAKKKSIEECERNKKRKRHLFLFYAAHWKAAKVWLTTVAYTYIKIEENVILFFFLSFHSLFKFTRLEMRYWALETANHITQKGRSEDFFFFIYFILITNFVDDVNREFNQYERNGARGCELSLFLKIYHMP
jgi:hypothetical protein